MVVVVVVPVVSYHLPPPSCRGSRPPCAWTTSPTCPAGTSRATTRPSSSTRSTASSASPLSSRPMGGASARPSPPSQSAWPTPSSVRLSLQLQLAKSYAEWPITTTATLRFRPLRRCDGGGGAGRRGGGAGSLPRQLQRPSGHQLLLQVRLTEKAQT